MERLGCLRWKITAIPAEESPSGRQTGQYHVVSNVDHTDAIVNCLRQKQSFEEAVKELSCEPDAPHHTPRIAGLVNTHTHEYKLAIIRSVNHDARYCARQIYSYNDIPAGKGYCITTYEGDSDPLPSFSGEPVMVDIRGSIGENIDQFWNMLDAGNRVAILVKSIGVRGGKCSTVVLNRHEPAAPGPAGFPVN